MKDSSKKRIALSRIRALWVGECLCGQLAYETPDGRIFLWQTDIPHSERDCLQQRKKPQLVTP